MNVRILFTASRDGASVTLLELAAIEGPILYVVAVFMDVDPAPQHNSKTTTDREQAGQWYDGIVQDLISPEVG